MQEEKQRISLKNGHHEFDWEGFFKGFAYPMAFLLGATGVIMIMPGEPDKALLGAIVGVFINRARKGAPNNTNGEQR